MEKIKYNFFLDTNVYQAKDFDFNDDIALQYLKEHCTKGIVQLFSNDIIISECKLHINQKAKELKKLAYITIKNANIGLTVEQINSLRMAVEIETKKYVTNLLDKYIVDTKCIILDNKNINIDNIIKKYFNRDAPFGTQGKKDEFPDAIIIESLLNFISEHNEKFIVVSNDKDWKDALCNIESVIFFKDIKEALNYIFSNVKSLATELLEELCNIKQVLSKIKAKIEGNIVYSDDFKSDIQIDDVNFDVPSTSIFDFSNDQIVIAGEVNADISFSGKLFNEFNSAYDSEKKDYIYEDYTDTNGETRVLIEFYLTLDIRNKTYQLKTSLDNKNFFFDGSKLYFY